MSRSRELQLHIEQLDEIRSILNAMKNLAFMAVHKLSRSQELQQQVLAHIENNAAAFLAAYPLAVANSNDLLPVYLVIGSERGFCGDLNERLLDKLINQPCAGIIAVGSRLIGRCESYPYQVIASFAGANVEEEVLLLLEQILQQLEKLSPTQSVKVIYHDHESNRIQQRQVLPPFAELPAQAPEPLLLNLSPELFFSELVEQYLLALLHEILYTSLLSENRLRLQHLEGAVQHLDEQTTKLHRKSQIYRQEEITEEIEVILLNTDSV